MSKGAEPQVLCPDCGSSEIGTTSVIEFNEEVDCRQCRTCGHIFDCGRIEAP